LKQPLGATEACEIGTSRSFSRDTPATAPFKYHTCGMHIYQHCNQLRCFIHYSLASLIEVIMN